MCSSIEKPLGLFSLAPCDPKPDFYIPLCGALSNLALQLSTPQLELPELLTALGSISNFKAGLEHHDCGRSRPFSLSTDWNCLERIRTELHQPRSFPTCLIMESPLASIFFCVSLNIVHIS